VTDPTDWTDEQRDAVDEFRHAAREFLASADAATHAGRRYALGMAATACQMLGLDPSRITPDGYSDGAP
jgi:hypothetical protein